MENPDGVGITLRRGSSLRGAPRVLCPKPWRDSRILLRTADTAGRTSWRQKTDGGLPNGESANFRSKSWAAGQTDFNVTTLGSSLVIAGIPDEKYCSTVETSLADNVRSSSSPDVPHYENIRIVKPENNSFDKRNVNFNQLESGRQIPTSGKPNRRRKSSSHFERNTSPSRKYEYSSEEDTALEPQKRQTSRGSSPRIRAGRQLSLADGLNSPVLQRKLHKAITRRSHSDNNFQKQTRKIRVEGYTYKVTMEPPGLCKSTDADVVQPAVVADRGRGSVQVERFRKAESTRSASVPESEIRKHANIVKREATSLTNKEMKQAQQWVSEREVLARRLDLAKPISLLPAEDEGHPGNGVVDNAPIILPSVDSREALDCAALRLRRLSQELDEGNVTTKIMKDTLQYAVSVLEMKFLNRTSYSDDDSDADASLQGDSVVPPEIKRWLMQTFSTSGIDGKAKRKGERRTLRSVVHVMQAGMFVERMFRKSSAAANYDISPEIHNHLRDINKWHYDIFELEEISGANALKYTFYEVISKYDFMRKYKISGKSLFAFCDRLQIGYMKHNNQYHNPIHAADVTQCISVFLNESGFVNYLSELEVFAMIFAAAIHDLEHTGTTNNFHTQTRSELALLYNDKSVLENHHVSAAFRIMWEDPECDILASLSKDDYKLFRELVIDMVLATDMSRHFGQVKNMKSMLQHPEKMERSKAMSLMMHCADISNATRPWEQHHRWTERLMEEFFQQGDKERELQLPLSPLVDRHSTMIAQSQIGFIDYVIKPTFDVLNELFWIVSVSEPPSGGEKENGPTAYCSNVSSTSTDDSPLSSPRRYSEATSPNREVSAKNSLKSQIRAFRNTIGYCLKRNRQKWVEKDKDEQLAKRSKEKSDGQNSSNDNGTSTT